MEKYLIKINSKTGALSSTDLESELNNNMSTERIESITTVTVNDTDDLDSNVNDMDEEENINAELVKSNSSKKRKRYTQKFREEWLTAFSPWLINKNDQPYCNICNKQIKGSVTHIKRHENAKYHKNKIATIRATAKKINEYIPTDQMRIHQERVHSSELKLLAFLHEHNLPFLLMDHLCPLLQSVCPDSAIAKDINCSRTKATVITTQNLVEESTRIIQNKVKGKFYSIIIDETTDTSTKKSLAVIIRFFDDVKVKTKDHFLGLLRITTADAETIFNSIMNLLQQNNLEVKKMLGFAADNAAVMMGEKKGVKARLKEVIPHLFILGCTCHSIHLCSSAAAKKLPKSVEQFVRNIFNHFTNSSKRIEDLEECQKFINIKPHKMLRPCQTRWLSLQAVVDRVLDLWDALILHFTNFEFEERLHSSDSVLSNLKNPIFKGYLFFLSYILEIVNRLNLEFQSETIKIHLLQSRITGLYKTILKNFIKKSYLEKVDVANINPSNPHNFLPLEQIYVGTKLQILIEEGNIHLDEIKKMRINILAFYVELTNQIKSRFDFNNPILNFVSKFDPHNIFSENEYSSIHDGIKYFPDLVENLELLNTEWRLLPDVEEVKKHKNDQFQDFWCFVLNFKNEINECMFPNLKNIVTGIMCLPHSSASTERIFSQLNLIKSKTRNRLNIETCSAILHSKQLIYLNNARYCYEWQPSNSLLKKKTNYEKSNN